ncbi:hypothetical protein K2173_022352 [Erythroxylum novogranatense]|uniref:Pentatricopeptide repeat-containing protein n=1 Tax=Erythroxylum novogranatense TaxID=1862640 RepID=A0AAV8TK19_9ROSI|nr:hypothetical protein K2173_022352 [Erythroxylum novogranatense]
MQVLSNARRLTNISFLSSDFHFLISPHISQNHHFLTGNCSPISHPLYARVSQLALFSTSGETAPSDDVKELHGKIIDLLTVKRSSVPNSWIGTMVTSCRNRNDIELLFDTLHNLRIFRLSSQHIHKNFNYSLCREVTKACTRAGALDYGKKTLSRHNVYGLSPTIGSAHNLLGYAKDHSDTKLMVDILQRMKLNDVALQPGTADLVFSICYNSKDWNLISKCSNKFLKAGVKLRGTAFDLWMDFAAKRGDVEALWEINNIRSESIKYHSLLSAFSCAKALILEGKPGDAATIVHVLYQALPDNKKSDILVQLQRLVGEWPLDVIKHQKEDNRKAVAASLKSNIPAMVTDLTNLGLEVNVNLEDLTTKEIPC